MANVTDNPYTQPAGMLHEENGAWCCNRSQWAIVLKRIDLLGPIFIIFLLGRFFLFLCLFLFSFDAAPVALDNILIIVIIIISI